MPRRPVLRYAPLAAFLLLAALAACGARVPPELRPLGTAAPGAAAPLEAEARAWVEETLASLSPRARAAQVVSVWMSGGYAAEGDEEMERLGALVDAGIGAVTISIGLPHEYAARLNALQARARVPLLIGSDFESGGPGMRMAGIYALPSLLDLGGGTRLPATMAFGAIGDEEAAHEAGRITGSEARAVGVHVAFAPVLDVNSDPENPIINTRAFGEDPHEVARLGTAWLRGAQEAGLLTTAKHFPGHGDTRQDSHIELPSVTADRARLDSVELVPFRAAIDAGVDAVMTAHIAAPRILGPDPPPATLSPWFMTELLREELGFGGLLYTDAMTMGAIVDRLEPGEAAVRALQAGADVILSPADPVAAIEAIEAAVASGRLPAARLEAAVRRTLEAKARAGLHRGRQVDPRRIRRVVGAPAHRAFAASAAARSLTLARDLEGLVPLPGTAGAGGERPAAGAGPERPGAGTESGAPGPVRRVLSVTFAPPQNPAAGRAFERRLEAGGLEVARARTEPGTPAAVWDSLALLAVGADAVLLSAYVAPRPWAGSVDVSDPLGEFAARVRDGGTPVLLLSFGSPYLLRRAPDVGTYLLAWGGAEPSQRAAAEALLGIGEVTGRLPISLPPFHRRGEGLRRPLAALPPMSVGPEDPAEAAGMDPAALARVDRLLRVAVADSATPGAALAVGRRGRLVRLRGYGRTDWGPDAPAATDSTIWDLASLTKAVGTATAILRLAERGRLSLDEPVARWLEEWRGGPLERATIRDLLLHRSGLPSFLPLWRELEGREAYRRALAEVEPVAPPGDSTVYSDLGFLALGLVAEEAAGRPLDALLEAELFGPLGMRETGFRPAPGLRDRIAPTERDTVWRKRHVHGEVHDENAHALGGVAGHAGLFSSARDLAAFAEALLRGGVALPCPGPASPRARGGRACARARADSARILSPESVALLARPPDSAALLGRPPEGGEAGDEREAGERDEGRRGGPARTHGWQAPAGRSSAGDYLSARAFGHTGFTGTSVWIDPELDLFVVLLTSRTNPSRENRAHLALRRAVHDAVARAIQDVPVRRR